MGKRIRRTRDERAQERYPRKRLQGKVIIALPLVRPSTGCTVQLLVQELPVEVMVDIRVEVSMLRMEQYYSFSFKFPIKRHITLLQGGADALLIAGPFSI